MTARISKKALKEPDVLQRYFADFLLFLRHHQSKLYVLLALILFAVAVFAGWQVYRFQYNQKALKMYRQIEALAGQGDSNKADEVIQGYQNVISTFPSSDSALYALYRAGNLYVDANRHDDAIKTYNAFISQASDLNDLKIFAFIGKGYCYEVKQDFKNALESFNKALQFPESKTIEGIIFRDIARMHEMSDNSQKAREYYRKSLEKTKDPTMEALLKRKIAELH